MFTLKIHEWYRCGATSPSFIICARTSELLEKHEMADSTPFVSGTGRLESRGFCEKVEWGGAEWSRIKRL
jgi:hypothetical protein